MDIQYMKRALELAQNGIGHTNPNPLVGAVIVKDGRIIGEGYHEFYGSCHAEVNAFNHATEDVKDATLYVTLEPCSHYGKTPPCAKAIIEKGIKKVVVGLTDPNPLVAGRGIEMLRSNGIQVVTGVLEDEGKKMNEIFLKYITTGLPFCILKTAMTLDGKIATHTGQSKWITNALSREYVHQLRHKVSGIMAGIGTVLADDPMLNTRIKNGEGSDPVRIIVDSNLRIPFEAKVLHVKSKAKTIIAATEKAPHNKMKMLEEMGAEVILTPPKDNQVDLGCLMKALGEKQIDSVLLEGGSTLNYAALEQGIVDKANVFIAPKFIGGSNALTPVGGKGIADMKDAIKLHSIELHRFEDDLMIEGYIRKEG